jgi:xylan 1,4-beta-xylosidase
VGRRCALVAVLAGLLVGVVLPTARAAEATPVTLAVEAADVVGPTNERLLGLGWNTGPIDGVIPLRPPTIRIDASLQTSSRGPGDLELSEMLGRIREVRRAGAEPLVVLSYMPPWLANALPFGLDPRDPTRLAPKSMDRWQQLIEQVVEAAATAPAPAYRFEVWNEPDLPIFFLDTPSAFLQLAQRTHLAVAAVEARTGLDLEVGGPGAAVPNLAHVLAYKAATAAVGVPPDFISWHFYGNMLLGPDGNEGFLPDPLYQLVSGRNPFTTPRHYGLQVRFMRAALGDDVELVIDEWNLSAGGFDARHDTNEGAAFQAAVLTEMERAGLDAADLYRGVDDADNDGRVGDWGLVDSTGRRKPGWWVFDAWRQMAGTRVETSGDQPGAGWWARATRAGSHLDVLLSSFRASGGKDRAVTIDIEGFTARCALVRTIAGPEDSFSRATELDVISGQDPVVSLPPQSVVWVRLGRTCP